MKMRERLGCLSQLLVVLLCVATIQLLLLHELGGHIVWSVAGELIAKNLTSDIVFATK